jgi:RNA polymerase sigma-70 factor (ECF subfamily)
VSERNDEGAEVGDRPTGAVTPQDEAKLQEFERFYRSDMASLVRFMIANGASSYDASEAAQAAMVAAFRHWDKIATPKAWVRKVAQRELVKQWRDVAVGSAAEFDDIASDNPSDLAPSAEAAVLLSEQSQGVLRALGQLPQSQRTTLARHLDGYTTTEIAEHLNTTEPTVRSQLRHARRRVAELLKNAQLMNQSENNRSS